MKVYPPPSFPPTSFHLHAPVQPPPPHPSRHQQPLSPFLYLNTGDILNPMILLLGPMACILDDGQNFWLPPRRCQESTFTEW